MTYGRTDSPIPCLAEPGERFEEHLRAALKRIGDFVPPHELRTIETVTQAKESEALALREVAHAYARWAEFVVRRKFLEQRAALKS